MAQIGLGSRGYYETTITSQAPDVNLAAVCDVFQPLAELTRRKLGGATEASNVDMGDAMVDMMDAQRAYELASKAIHQQDEMMGIANGVKR